MIKLSKNNNFVRLYKAMYPDSILPRSICPLFWKVLVGLLLTILSPAAILYGGVQKLSGKRFYWFKDFGEDSIWSMFYIDKFTIFIWVGVSALFGGDSIEWYDFILGPILFIGLIYISTVVAVLGQMAIEWITSKANKTKKPSVIGEAIKAQWNKICPIIEYED